MSPANASQLPRTFYSSAEIIKELTTIPIVESLETLIQDGKTVQYKVSLVVPDLELYPAIRDLWGFGVVALSNGAIAAKYTIRPQELTAFRQKLKELNSYFTGKEVMA